MKYFKSTSTGNGFLQERRFYSSNEGREWCPLDDLGQGRPRDRGDREERTCDAPATKRCLQVRCTSPPLCAGEALAIELWALYLRNGVTSSGRASDPMCLCVYGTRATHRQRSVACRCIARSVLCALARVCHPSFGAVHVPNVQRTGNEALLAGASHVSVSVRLVLRVRCSFPGPSRTLYLVIRRCLLPATRTPAASALLRSGRHVGSTRGH